MGTVSRVAQNSMALMVGQVYGVVINLVAISIIARYLPLKVFGEYGFILATCVTLSMLADMGIDRILIREIAREHHRDNGVSILTATVMIKVLLSVLAFAVIMLVVWVGSGSPGMVLGTMVCALATIVTAFGDIAEGVFKAYERMKNNAALKIVEDTSYLIGVLVVVTLDLGLMGIFAAMLVSAVIRLMVGIGILSRSFFLPRLDWDLGLMKWIFKEALPIGLNRVFRKAGLRIDTIILKFLRTTEEVGIFHGVYRIILIASILPFNVTEALFPIYSRYARDSQASLRMAFEKSFKFLLIAVLPLILIGLVLADPIVHLFLGKGFSTAAPLMRLMVLLLGFRFFTILCTKVLNASDQQKRATHASGLALAVNVVLDVVLIWFYGYMGAGLATLVSDIVLFVVSMIYVRRHVCPFDLRAIATKPLLLILFAGLIVFSLRPLHGVTAVLLGLGAYVVFLFVFRVFEDDELDVMRMGLRRVHLKLKRVKPLDLQR